MIYSAAGLAIICLIATGILDIVFKIYAAQPRSRGMLIFGVGVVWTLCHLSIISISDRSLEFNSATLIFGLAAATCVTLSNILLVESFGHLPVSTASTIYRLNTLPLVLLAFVFLGEDLGYLRGTGIFLGVITVLLLYSNRQDGTRNAHPHSLFLAVIMIASVIRALYGIFTKIGIEAGANQDAMILLAATGWIAGGLIYAAWREKQLFIKPEKLPYMVIAGLLVYAIIWLITEALTLGDANLVMPIANMGFVAAFLISVLAGLEKINCRKAVAIGSAMLSIVALTLSTP